MIDWDQALSELVKNEESGKTPQTKRERIEEVTNKCMRAEMTLLILENRENEGLALSVNEKKNLEKIRTAVEEFKALRKAAMIRILDRFTINTINPEDLVNTIVFLKVCAHLSNNPEAKEFIVDCLSKLVNHPHEDVRIAAAEAKSLLSFDH